MVEHEDEDEKFALVLFHIPFADWPCHTSNVFLQHELVGFRRVYYETGLLKAQANCRGSLRSLDSPDHRIWWRGAR